MNRPGIRHLVALVSAAAAIAAAGCGSSSKPKPPSQPTLTSVTPSKGTVSTIVSLTGSNFTSSTTVTFASGGNRYPAAAALTATGIDATVPSAAPATPGTVYDVVVTDGGTSTTLSNAFTMAAPVVTDVNGGLAGTAPLNSAFIVDGSSFGDLTASTTGFSLDFTDPTTKAVTSATASVSFATGDWANIFIVAVVPGTLSQGVTYQLTVTTPSGTSAPRDFVVEKAVTFRPAYIQWAKTTSLPVALRGLASVVATLPSASAVYAIGGNTSKTTDSNSKNASVATVYSAPLTSTGATAGAVGAWSTLTPLPDNRGFAAAVIADQFNSVIPGAGTIYVLGGLDGAGAATSTVYFASLAADGTIPASGSAGTWATTTALPQPLFATGAILFHGRIYVAGGNDSTGTPSAKVYSARINSDGTLGAWDTLLDLPVALAYHQLVTFAGYVYTIGGDTVAADPVTSVAGASVDQTYYEQIDIRNGAFRGAAWTLNANTIGKAREKFTAVVAGDSVLLTGGLYSGLSNGSSEELYAQFQTGGALGTTAGAGGSSNIYAASGTAKEVPYGHAAVYFVDSAATPAPHVIVLGGGDANTGLPLAGVYYQY